MDNEQAVIPMEEYKRLKSVDENYHAFKNTLEGKENCIVKVEHSVWGSSIIGIETMTIAQGEGIDEWKKSELDSRDNKISNLNIKYNSLKSDYTGMCRLVYDIMKSSFIQRIINKIYFSKVGKEGSIYFSYNSVKVAEKFKELLDNK